MFRLLSFGTVKPRSGTGARRRAGENGRAGRGKPPLPKSVWDGRLAQGAIDGRGATRWKLAGDKDVSPASWWN